MKKQTNYEKQLLFKYKGSSLYTGTKELRITSEGLLFPVHYGLKIAHASANDEAFLIEIYPIRAFMFLA